MNRERIVTSRITLDSDNKKVKDTHGTIAMQGVVQKSDVEGSVVYDLENDLVSSYRENATYDNNYIVSTSKGSLIKTTYCDTLNGMYYPSAEKQLHGCWNEKPRPVIVTGTTAGNTLHLVGQSSGFTIDVPCESGVTRVYNLIPGEAYVCQEKRGSTVVKTTNFTTGGTVRQIYVDTIPNFRDLGGYPCYDDSGNVIGHLKYGKIFRGFGFVPMTYNSLWKYVNIDYANRNTLNSTYPDYKDRIESAFATLRALGITKELDLRGDKKTDVTKTDNAFNSGYTGVSDWYHNYQIKAYGNTKDNGTFSTTKDCWGDASTSNTQSSAANLARCLKLIADTIQGSAIWFHCKTGADRTGCLAAIIMALCGCKMKDIVTDWELTSFCRSGYQMYLGGASNDMRTFMKVVWNYTGASGTLRNRMLNILTSRCSGVSGVNLGRAIKQIWAQFIDGYDGQFDNDVVEEPEDYTFYQNHLSPNGFQSGTGYGITKNASSYATWEFAEFEVSAGQKVKVGVNDGTKLATFFAESTNGLVDAALALNVNSQLSSGWLADCYEFHYSTIPLHYEKINGVWHYWAEYTVKNNCKLTVALKVNNNTTESLGGAYVEITQAT